jgi:hypothetical protein
MVRRIQFRNAIIISKIKERKLQWNLASRVFDELIHDDFYCFGEFINGLYQMKITCNKIDFLCSYNEEIIDYVGYINSITRIIDSLSKQMNVISRKVSNKFILELSHRLTKIEVVFHFNNPDIPDNQGLSCNNFSMLKRYCENKSNNLNYYGFNGNSVGSMLRNVSKEDILRMI